jgi:hypothetical protein
MARSAVEHKKYEQALVESSLTIEGARGAVAENLR